jgi:hypothetical protein
LFLHVHLFEVADVAKVRAWAAGSDLKRVMEKVGLLGAPTISFID